MDLDHEFTVPVPVDQAWPVLLDVERIAPCMPGATLDSADGDEFTGRLKVRLGAMTITYRGSARIVAKDDAAHTVTIEASGKEARGSGTANATVQARLHEEGGQTRVTVHTKLNVTGRPAQFGRGILAEVGGRLVGRFAANLAEELGRDETGPAAETAPPEQAGQSGGPEQAGQLPASPAAEAGDREDRPAGQAEPVGSAQAGPATEALAEAASAAARESAAGPATPTPTPTTPPEPRRERRRPSEEAIDLLEVAGPSIAKRAAPVLGALAVLAVIWRILRRRR